MKVSLMVECSSHRWHRKNVSDYKCPLLLEIIPSGAGWADVKLDIGDDHFDCEVSYIGDSIHDLVERVFYLYPDWNYDEHNQNVMKYYDEIEAVSTIDGVTAKRRWINVPWKTELFWDGEGAFIKWTMERPATNENDFDVTITLDVSQEDESSYTYQVKYKDLCYAVAKGVTELLVRYGLIGYYETTWMDDINIRHFLHIKEIALDMKIELESAQQESRIIYTTRLGQEMDLLIRPLP